jgi:hypothetical protein
MQKTTKIFLWVLVIGGSFVGAFVLAPAIQIDTRLGTVIGGLAGGGIAFWLFPELRKAFAAGRNEKPSKLRQQRIAKELQLGWRRSVTHPTNLPITLAALWFIVFTALIILFPTLLDRYIENKSVRLLLFSLPFLFLIGLSGLLMILRKELIDQFGHRHHGFPVYFNGILGLLLGWGGCIAFIWATFFSGQ